MDLSIKSGGTEGFQWSFETFRSRVNVKLRKKKWLFAAEPIQLHVQKEN